MFSKLFFPIFILSLISCNMNVDKYSTKDYPTGLITLTKEEADILKLTQPQVVSVKLNSLALNRINEERQRLGLVTINQSSAPMGEVTVTLIGENTYNEDDLVISQNELLPKEVDNSKLNSFPPVGHQGNLGSCASWVTTYYQHTHMVNLLNGTTAKTGNRRNISSPQWTYNFANRGKRKGTALFHNYDILEKHGAASLHEFPYDEDYTKWASDKNIWRNAIEKRTNKYEIIHNVSTTGIQKIKKILLNGYLVTFSTYIYNWKYRYIRNNPYSDVDDPFVGKKIVGYLDGDDRGGHALTIVGYNDDIWVDINKNNLIDPGELGAFKLVNSWGKKWGDGGFVWFSYDALKEKSDITYAPAGPTRMSGVKWNMAYIQVPKENYSPELLAEIDISHQRRNELFITPGAWDFTTSLLPLEYACGHNNRISRADFLLCPSESFFGNFNYAHPFNGIMVFDMTDIKSIDFSENKEIFIRILYDKSLGGPSVNDIRLVDLSNSRTINLRNDKFVYRNSDIGTIDAWFDIGNRNPNPISCEEGFYLTNGLCRGVGRGYYSPSHDNNRYACTNKPLNALSVTYADANSGSNNCPIEMVNSCESPYDPIGNSCVQDTGKIFNSNITCFGFNNTETNIINFYKVHCLRCADKDGLKYWFDLVNLQGISLERIEKSIYDICSVSLGLPQMATCERQSENAAYSKCPQGYNYLPNNSTYCFMMCQ